MVINKRLLDALLLLFSMASVLKSMPVDEMLEFNEYLESTINGEPDETFDEVFDDDKQNIWEHSGKFEGDILLSDRQRKAILDDVSTPGLARNGLNDVAKRWPKATLVYTIRDDQFSSDQINAIKEGMDDLERNTCVKFKEKTDDDDDFVEIQGRRRGCFSQVGYQGRGKQLLNLTPHPTGAGCMRHGTIVHELLHSLGFFHMQSHTKRDDYVKIEWDNIIDGRENNFKKYNSFETTDFGVPYDYDSVLHYSAYAFSKNGQKTIVPLSDGFVTIGQRHGLSDKDVAKLNRMYECSGTYDEPKSKHDGVVGKGVEEFPLYQEVQYREYDDDAPSEYETAMNEDSLNDDDYSVDPRLKEREGDSRDEKKKGAKNQQKDSPKKQAVKPKQHGVSPDYFEGVVQDNKKSLVKPLNIQVPSEEENPDGGGKGADGDKAKKTDDDFLFSWDRYKDFFPKSFFNFESWWD